MTVKEGGRGELSGAVCTCGSKYVFQAARGGVAGVGGGGDEGRTSGVAM